MTHYLLSTHSIEGEVRQPPSQVEMQAMHERLGKIEAEMKASGMWVFSARLHGPETATVVRATNGEVLTTDGPFVEAKEHLGGFYIVDAPDLDAALSLAAKVSEAIRRPIEVWPFAGVEGA
jgi:hypothetical protein